MTDRQLRTAAATLEESTSGWAYLAALAPIIGTTYVLTTSRARNIGGLVYLVLISRITAHTLWFWGLRRLSASSVTCLSLLNPLVAARLGWAVLGQRLDVWQVFAAVIVLVAVLLGQSPPPPRSTDPRS